MKEISDQLAATEARLELLLQAVEDVERDHLVGDVVDEPRSYRACALTITFVGPLVLGGLVVNKFGRDLHTLWMASMWSLASLLWSARYLQVSVHKCVVDCSVKLLGRIPCRNAAYAEGNLTYEVQSFARQFPFFAARTLTLGVLGVAGIAATSASGWLHSLTTFTFGVIDHPREKWKSNLTGQQDIANFVMNDKLSCDVTGLVPMPWLLLVVKLVACGFLQDLVFGSEDLLRAERKPIGPVSKIFVAYQLFSALLSYGAAVHSAFQIYSTQDHQSIWFMYQLIAYRTFFSCGYVNTILMACKMLVETNLHRTGSPRSFDCLNKYKVPEFVPSITVATRATVFWVSSIILLIPGVPILLTHVIPAIAYILCALSFPVWGIPCLAFSYWNSEFEFFVKDWAQAHAETTGMYAMLIFLVLIGMWLRERLWRVQCYFEDYKVNGKVNGPYGYTKGTMTLFFAFPAVFVMQTLPVWADLLYNGYWLGGIPSRAFNSQRLAAYSNCFLHGHWQQQVLRWFAVI